MRLKPSTIKMKTRRNKGERERERSRVEKLIQAVGMRSPEKPQFCSN